MKTRIKMDNETYVVVKHDPIKKTLVLHADSTFKIIEIPAYFLLMGAMLRALNIEVLS
jgi:hypothetical protein